MMLDTNCAICTKCSFSPFCHEHLLEYVSTHQINGVVKQTIYLKKNDVLCDQKNTFRSIYAVRSGHIKIYQLDAQGNELIHGFYFPGEIVGFEAICSNHHRYSSVALTDTVVCEIPYDAFLAFIQASPMLQKHILYLMSQQLNAGSYLSYVTAEQRLAAFLVDLCQRLSPTPETTFFIPMSRQEIGSYLKLTAETISRILSQFKKSEIILIDHKNIQILQLATLQAIASP